MYSAALQLLYFCCVVADPEKDLCAASGHSSTFCSLLRCGFVHSFILCLDAV